MNIDRVTPVLNKIIEDLDPAAVWLFGSYAHKEQTAQSDLDIAAPERTDVSNKEWYMYAQELAVLAGIDVDLIRMREATTVLQNQIVRTGVRLYAKDEVFVDEYELRCLKEYFWLEEERAGILEDVCKGGSKNG